MARVTIGIPFYNCENTLADTVRSVFAQTFQDWELVLLNDGSTDGSLVVAQSIKDERVRVVSDGINKGIGARRRQIVEMSSADLLAWQDADDMMHPNRLAVQIDYLEQNPELSAVDSLAYRIDDENAILGINPSSPKEFTLGNAIKQSLLLNGATLGKTQMYRDHAFDPSLRRGEDWDVFIRAIQACSFAHITQPLYFRRHISSSILSTALTELSYMPYAMKLLFRYSPQLYGWPKTLLTALRLDARCIMRSIVSVVGLRFLAPGTRLRGMTDQDQLDARTALEQIMQTRVPGLDS